MHRTLSLLDVSTFAHAGSVNQYAFLEQLQEVDNVWMTQRTPAGGASLIFNTLAAIAGNTDIVLCCDRNPVIKKDMIPGYKGDRHHSQLIEVEKRFIEYVFEKCGLCVEARDGYEADDIIYSYWKTLHPVYDKIFIYTNDSDLYFLVDEKTEIMPASSKGQHVTINNYSKTKIHGYEYKYNVITVSKILYGDKTDCIPPLDKSLLNLALEELRPFLDGCPHVLGDKDKLVEILSKYPSVVDQINKVYPLLIEDVRQDIPDPDPQALCNWGAAIHNKNFARRQSPDFDVEEETRKVQELGIYIEKEM